MGEYWKSGIYLVVALFTLGFLGCAMTVKKYSEPSQGLFTDLAQPLGTSAFAEPILEENEIAELFGVNLLEKNILPVYFAIRNNTSDLSLTVPAESIRVGGKEGGNFGDSPEKASLDASEISGVIGSILIAPILMTISAQERSDASIIKDSFENKMFRTSTIDPNEKAAGFFYFNLNQLRKQKETNFCFKVIDPLGDVMFPSCLPLKIRG